MPLRVPGDRPSAYDDTSLVYEPTGNRPFLDGGNGSASGAGAQELRRRHLALDAARRVLRIGRLLRTRSAAAPPGRRWHAALFDARRDRMVVHGGGDETTFNNDRARGLSRRCLSGTSMSRSLGPADPG